MPTYAPVTLAGVATMAEVITENTIPVLDHGFVRLDDAMASDLSVVNGSARQLCPAQGGDGRV